MTLIIVLVTIIIPTIVLLKKEITSQKTKTSFRYTVTITLNNDKNYTLYVPFPMWKGNISHQIWENLTIVSGGCSYKIEQTTHGFALNVSANGSVILESKGESKGDTTRFADRLSMYNESSDISYRGFWVYCDKEVNSTEIELEIYFEDQQTIYWYNGFGEQVWVSGGGPVGEVPKTKIIEGWQLVRGDCGDRVIN